MPAAGNWSAHSAAASAAGFFRSLQYSGSRSAGSLSDAGEDGHQHEGDICQDAVSRHAGIAVQPRIRKLNTMITMPEDISVTSEETPSAQMSPQRRRDNRVRTGRK